MGSTLGNKNGNQHAAPDLTVDIDVLMDSLSKHDVYIVKKGRKLADDDQPVVDCISEGRTALVWGASTPLDDFNESLRKLQHRRQIKPVVGTSILHDRTEGAYILP